MSETTPNSETTQISETTSRRGRGLVIAGGILTVLSLIVSIAVAVNWFFLFLDPNTRGIAYFAGFLALLVLAAPTWYIGVPLLATGRSQQRGPVKSSVLAWIIAMTFLPAVFIAGALGSLLLLAFVPSVAATAWLVWGKPTA
jgi:hypothetical protein